VVVGYIGKRSGSAETLEELLHGELVLCVEGELEEGVEFGRGEFEVAGEVLGEFVVVEGAPVGGVDVCMGRELLLMNQMRKSS
jgi:hypothetical protein